MKTAQMYAWINARWEHHRALLTYTPTDKRTDCGGHHDRNWDNWIWKGDTLHAERGHCASCGRMFRGILSPWNDAAYADWENHPYKVAFNHQVRVTNQKRRIKSGYIGRKTTIFETAALCDR